MSKETLKSSDEILHELFDSLNLPISPKSSEKTLKEPIKDKKLPIKDSSDDESDSNLSLSSASSTDQEIYKLLEETADLTLPDKCDTIGCKSTSKSVTHKKEKKRKKLKKDNEGKSKNKKKKKKKNHKNNNSGSDNDRKYSKISKYSETHILETKKKAHNTEDENFSKETKSKSSSHSKSRSRSHSRSRSNKSISSRSRSKSKSKSSKLKPASKSRHHHSRSRSKSGSHRNGNEKSHRGHSYSSSNSPSPRRSKAKSKSRSRSPIKKETADPLDIWRNAKLASLKKNSSLVKSNMEKDECKSSNETKEKAEVLIETIPLPYPTDELESKINPSVIPLPSVDSEDKQSTGLGLDLEAIPIPLKEEATNSTNPESTGTNHESSISIAKTSDSSIKKLEEGKGKLIVIKSLKDSLVIQQAEEAQKKSKFDDDKCLGEEVSEGKDTDSTDTGLGEAKDEVALLSQDPSSATLKEDCSPSSKDKKLLQEKDVMEEGEIQSENELEKCLKQAKSSRKDKKKDKKHKESSVKDHKKKSESKKSKHRSRSRSRSKRRSRSRSRSKTKRKSRSKSRSRRKSKSRSRSRKPSRSISKASRRSRSKSRSRRKGSRSRSKSKGVSTSRVRSRKRSRSPSVSVTRSRTSRRSKRSSSRDKRSPDCVDSLRDKATRKRLLEVARRNAVYLMKNNCLPPSIEKESVKATGKSVEELTSFCQQLVAKDYSDTELSDPSLSPDEQDSQFDKPFGTGRHPFAIKDSKPILMNIRNAPMLPTKTNAERLADTSKLREQFPVSSGSEHRNVAEIGWVPVKKDEAKTADEVTVFPEARLNEVDISQLVSTRLNAMRRLQDNPSDRDAMKALSSAQKEMQDWALSKQKPGQFTGSTGARILSQEELSSGYQAWARKEQFKEANPVSSHFGMKMLQKMGWNPGEGLGKNKEGQIEPLLLDVKMDKKGLTAQQEMTPRRTPIPLAKSLAGKHPVSALVEICSKRKWGPPEFEIVFDCGPDHKKNFLIKVHVNNQTYKPAIAASTKKIAKANAAAACLQALGLIPKDVPSKPQATLNTISPSPQSGQAQGGAASATPQASGTVQNASQTLASPQPSSSVSSIPQPPTTLPQAALQAIPQPQAPPLPSSAPLPPLPQGDPCAPNGSPREGQASSQMEIPVPPSGQIPSTNSASPMGSQPIKYPAPVAGMYGSASLYAASPHFDQVQYYGASGHPYQGSSLQ